MGELLTVATSWGKCHWGNCGLCRHQCSSASGCSSLACQRKRQRETCGSVLVPTVPPVWGLVRGHRGAAWMGTVLRLWDSASSSPWLCRLLWQKVTWHGQRASGIMILFYLSFLFSFHINVSMKKRKTLSVSGTVTFLFFHVRLLCLFMFQWLFVLMLFYSSKEKAQNFNSKGKKQQ